MSRSDVSTEQRQPAVSLTPKDVKLRESVGNEFKIFVPAGVPIERLSESSFYATISHQFHPGDELIMCPVDRTYWARYLVLQSGMGYCEVHQLAFVQLPAMLCAVGERLPSNHKLVYCGQEEMWSAVRNSDGVVIIKNAISQEACLQELLQHASLRG